MSRASLCWIAGAALVIGAPAFAATTPAKPAAHPAVAAKPAAPVAKPAAKPGWFSSVSKPAAKPAARPAAGGRMVQARLSNGKTVTYNCSLAGNQTKQACKR